MAIEIFERTWNPNQVAFITSPKRYAAFVGAMGCGKTDAFCRRARAIAVKYPGSRGLLARYTYNEVNDALVPQFLETTPESLIVPGGWHKSSGTLTLRAGPGGKGTSVILFRNLEDPRKYRSENFNFFGISQADESEITLEHWEELVFRLRRQSGPYGRIAKQYGFLEANYRGHSWIWQLFTKEGQVSSGRIKEDGTPYKNEKTGAVVFDSSDYQLVEGRTEDNVNNLPPEYIRDMEAMPDEWKKRYYYGTWDEMGGIVYDDFGADHLVAGVFYNGQWQAEIPSHWHKYRTIDYGSRNVTCCLWATMSPSGTIYIYDEYYRPGLALEHGKKIYERHARWDQKSETWLPTEKYQWTVIDPSAFNKGGIKDQETGGESPADQFFAAGVGVSRAPVSERDVGSGITVVKRYLSKHPDAIDPLTKRPRLQIVGHKCPNLIRELREYVWDELGPTRRSKRNEPERPRKLRDHAVDALRYLLVSRPQPSPDMPRNKEAQEDAIRGMTRREIYETLWEV